MTCEHCGEEANLFLRQSEVGKPAACPKCGKEMRGEAEKVDEAAPPPAASRGITCVKCD
jgi:DNA-directed RNA polymerase subunit RPC12/RpoP